MKKIKEIKIVIDGKTLVYSKNETINFTKEFCERFFEQSKDHDTPQIALCHDILRFWIRFHKGVNHAQSKKGEN